MSGNMPSALGNACIRAAAIRGAEAVPVNISVSLWNGGVPGLSIDGMPDTRARELKQAVRCAIGSTGFELPRTAGEVRIDWCQGLSTAAMEFPVAAALLAASGQIPAGWTRDCIFFGDLGLDGRVLPARGTVAAQELARQEGVALVTSASSRGIPDEGPRAIGASSISELRSGMPGRELAPMALMEREFLDVAALSGNARLKTCLALSAAGSIPLCIAAEDGMEPWKPVIAGALADIMGPLEPGEASHAARMASLRGRHDAFEARPVVRATTDSSIAEIVGGGRPLTPGMASEAATGVLVFDGIGDDRRGRGAWMKTVAGYTLRRDPIRIVRAAGGYELSSPRAVIAFEEEGSPAWSSAIALKAMIESFPAADGDPLEGRWRSGSTGELREAVERARWFAETSSSRVEPDRARSTAMEVAARVLADMDESAEIGRDHTLLASSLTSIEGVGMRLAGPAGARTGNAGRRGMRP